ncbi:MAG: exodeoxyribonuclease III [Paracoccus sp. (in: a-proteobacteria)]|uniref:exodeoxyribonuclease III n=1 Tax=Paracoccus sp. TaxID=267 RepID=UPI0026E0BBCD|nr:exodeoxyribonuclease III [Paracoccus sp. (in: a-proteobacteria)]MDO5632418.1 exodeoxyribonuclease III [Paracoccus sp. (in: a-proteobacteria)]
MKIATFNINGIKARINALTDWLSETDADVVVLQEIKSVDEGFPRDHFTDLGWNVETHGQKSFNGVAILSRLPLEDVTRGLPGDDADEQARWIEASVIGDTAVRIAGLYLPNGNPAPGPKYDYKLAWMNRLRSRARALLASEMPVVMLGDYNVIPEARDAARPQAWVDDALFLPDSRAALRRIVWDGWTDAIRIRDPFALRGPFTFWDYQGSSWERDNGIRIDHLLLSPQAADLMQDAGVDRDARGKEKPSDHVPVWVTLAA